MKPKLVVQMKPKLVVFGIDGASHGLCRELIDRGELPHLAALERAGAAGSLESTFPPHTAPGWTSMFTGVEPGTHGVYQFWDTQNPGYEGRVMGAQDFGWEPIWSTLERHGWSVGVVNVPMTHPVEPLRDGYMISWPLSKTLNYAEPRSLIGELARAGCHYHSDLVTMYRGQENYLSETKRFIEGRTKSLLYLLEHYPVDALFVVYTEVDRVSHHYWGASETPAAAVIETYQAVDTALGQIVDAVARDTTILVASDHGFGPCRANVNIHGPLEDAGLLATTYVRGELTEETFQDDMSPEGGASWFRDPARYIRVIDWEHTQVYMPTPGCFGLNINRRGRQRDGNIGPGGESVRLAETLTRVIEGIRDENGLQLFDLRPREQIYQGPLLDRAPDFLLIPRRWDVMPHPALGEPLLTPPTQEAVHRMDGILFAMGPGIRAGTTLAAHIEDVAPTLLALQGLPVPEAVDGSWLFSADEDIRREPARYRLPAASSGLTPDEERNLESRFTALGYA